MDQMFCRLCICNTNQYFTISDDLRSKIDKHLGIQIVQNALICNRCTEIVESFNEFHHEIQKQQQLFIEQNQKKDEVQFIILVEQQQPANSSDQIEEDVNNFYSDNNIENAEIHVEKCESDEKLSVLNLPSLDGFPSQIIKNGKLMIRGKELTKLISRFYKLECDICETKKRFRKFSAMNTHFRNQHSSRVHVYCCDMKITKLRQIAFHMARHIQPSAFKCNLCDKFLTSPKILLLHQQNHLPEEKRRLACPEVGCNRRFAYQSALVNHSLSHLSEENRTNYSCCDKKFLNPARLKSHIQNMHTSNDNKKEFSCKICSKNFTTKSNLSYHLTTHTRKHQVQCRICDKWLKNKVCLRKHMSIHGDVKHTCELCDYSSANKQCLINHQKVHHSEEKPFTCEECGNSFKLKNTLINHVNAMHKGLRKYQCEFCSKTFVSSGNYYSHRKRIHSEELSKKLQEREMNAHLERHNLILV